MFVLQSELPASAENTVPLALILYADKSKLSSFSTVKGYLVVVCCGNLPVNIWNSTDIGGGTIVRWLPIVSCSLWNWLRSFSTYFDRYLRMQKKKGSSGTLCSSAWSGMNHFWSYSTKLDNIWWLVMHIHAITRLCTGYFHSFWSFLPTMKNSKLIIYHLFNELSMACRCMMSLICGCSGKCPCPVCLVLLDKLHDLSKSFPLHLQTKVLEALATWAENWARGEEILEKLGLQPVNMCICHLLPFVHSSNMNLTNFHYRTYFGSFNFLILTGQLVLTDCMRYI